MTKQEIIFELQKYHARYHNKFKSGEEFWKQYYLELNRLLQEKDGWTQNSIDEASFNSFNKGIEYVNCSKTNFCNTECAKKKCEGNSFQQAIK